MSPDVKTSGLRNNMRLFSAIAVQLLAILLREGSKRNIDGWNCPAIEFTCNCSSAETPLTHTPSESLIWFVGIGSFVFGAVLTGLICWIRKPRHGNSAKPARRKGGGVLEDPGTW